MINLKFKIKILAAMSGGVDSSVAAALLVKQGYEVIGAFMKNWSDHLGLKGECRWYNERRDALRVAARLDIPFVTFDFEKEFRDSVINYLFKEYAAGRTPNPDIICNREIKFPLLLREAKRLECGLLATGHYARVRDGRLFQAKDKNKDQTYFLHQLRSTDLAKIIFPLGELTKPQVRALAKKFNLPTAEKDESMGICFVGEVPMADFLKQRIQPNPGDIVDVHGQKLGAHQGLAFYTIGQRHGLNINGAEPYYVASKDFQKNQLVVAAGAEEAALWQKEGRLGNIHWISGSSLSLPAKLEVKLRHRQPGVKAVLHPDGRLEFKKPERAITPGQFAVFYQDGECLGGGEII